MSDISSLKKTENKPRPKQGNQTTDIQFTNFLVKDMENLMCVDTSRIYAMGMGVGGGMVHLLACNPELSTSFAAYAVVGGVFGKSKQGKRPWGVCKPKRQIPIVEIHGLDDRIAGYYLNEGENGKKRTIPPHWLDDWAERNSCGEKDGDPVQSSEDETTFITTLDHGVMSETIQYGGGAIRVAKKCNLQKNEAQSKEPQEPQEGKQGQEKYSLPTSALNDEEATILHYQIKNYGHGWPRQHLKKQKEVIFKDKQVQVKDNTYFDTTEIVMNFFDAHILEEEFAKRSPVDEGPEGGPPSEEEMAEKMAKLGIEHAELGKKKKPAEAEIEEKLKQFRAAQEKIKKMNPAETDEKERDEL
jgi:poly(3-hydroxybutyrate) depolymerase